VEVTLEVSEGTKQEEPALPSGIGRLEHGGEADRVGCGCSFSPRADGRELGLGHTALGQTAPHRHLVRHQVRRTTADPGQTEVLGDCGDDRHRPIRRDREHAVDAVSPRDVDDRLDVDEVDHLRRIGLGEPGSVRVPVDGHDAQAQLLRAQDRAPLMASRADEEDRFHSRRCYRRDRRD
jgi:hypothetical protein